MRIKITFLETIFDAYRNASIKKKLNIALIAALSIPLFTSVVYALLFFGNKIQQDANNKNDSDLNLVRILYQNEVLEYEQNVSSFANDQELGLLLSINQTERALLKVLEKLYFSFLEFDMLHILNKNSHIIARVHKPDFLTYKDQLEKNVYFSSIIEGKGKISGTEVMALSFLAREGIVIEQEDIQRGNIRKKNAISIRASAPIYNHKTRKVVGVLVITKVLDTYSGFIQELSEKVGEPVSIYQKNNLAISSSETTETILSAEIKDTLNQGNRYSRANILKGSILGYQPLKNVQGDTIGALGVSASARDFQLTFIYGFLAFFGIGLGGLWLALKIRRILSNNILLPIHELHYGTKVLASGDYNHKIEIKNKDEIGELSIAFNRMAGDLKESYTQLEDKVSQRTAELVTKNDQLEQTLDLLNPGVSQLISTGKHELGLISATEFINDICGYTRMNILLSEKFVGNFINQYYQESHKILAMYRGFRDKTIGDQTVACFGVTKDAFVTSKHHAFDAVAAALEINKLLISMSKELAEYVQKYEADIVKKLKNLGEKKEEVNNIKFETRTGINTSLLDTDDDIDQLRMVMMGGLTGSDYTGQGGALIYAARLEANGAAREIHIGKNTANIIQEFFNLEQLESIAFKGLGERERYKILGRKYFFEKFGANLGIKQYQKEIPAYIYKAVNESVLGYISIKEVAKITKKIPVSINYYEHCDGRFDDILSRSLVLYAMSKKQGLNNKKIQDLILAYIVYKAEQLHPKDFVLVERSDILPVFAKDFKLKNLSFIKTLILQFKNPTTSKSKEVELVRLVEAYGNQVVDRSFLQKNKDLLLSSPAEFQQKNKEQFSSKTLKSFIELF